jgi:hypothetical protein
MQHLQGQHKAFCVERSRHGGNDEQVAALDQGLEVDSTRALARVDDRVSEVPGKLRGLNFIRDFDTGGEFHQG